MPKTDYQFKEMVATLVDKLDDFHRGLRDWTEVEHVLTEVRDEVKDSPQLQLKETG